MAAILRAIFSYLFLVLLVRVVGRRPGEQMTPFEFILIFFIGGLILTGMVGDERSFTNALCQIITIASMHFVIAWFRKKSVRFAKVVDGTPLVLLRNRMWCAEAMRHMRVADDDVMAAARDKGLERLDQIDYAVLERNGEISIIEAKSPSG